jgi:hypothetical protein
LPKVTTPKRKKRKRIYSVAALLEAGGVGQRAPAKNRNPH